MNNIYKTALLAALGLVTASVASAAPNDNLWLGFTSGSASSDLVIDLGATSGLIGQTSTVDLTSDLSSTELSSFNSIFSAGPNGESINLAVVGANSTFGKGDVWGTQNRVGGAGSSAATPGSSVTINTTSPTLTGAASSLFSDANLGTTVGGATADSTKAFSGEVGTGASSFSSKSGLFPNVSVGSGVVYADLWEVTAGKDTYEGYFTYDYSLSGANVSGQSLTFTGAAVAVPEPTTYGLIAGAGLLVVSLRNQFRRKQA